MLVGPLIRNMMYNIEWLHFHLANSTVFAYLLSTYIFGLSFTYTWSLSYQEMLVFVLCYHHVSFSNHYTRAATIIIDA